MKTVFLTLCYVLFVISVYSQDIIVKTDQTEIKTKIEEITETTIKYKKFEMLDGPTYNINVKDVFMIIYKNGTKEYMKASAKQEAVPAGTSRATGTTSSTGVVKQNQAQDRPAAFQGGHPQLVRKRNGVYVFENKTVYKGKDFIRLYDEYGYQDLSQKIKSSNGLYYGLYGGGMALLGVSFVINAIDLIKVVNDSNYSSSNTPLLLTVLGAGAAIGGRLYRAGVNNATAREFNIRSGNKVSQTFKVSPVLGLDPSGRGGKIGVSVGF